MVALGQLIFDFLGDIRTPDGNMGPQIRLIVKLPFRSEALRKTGIADSGDVNTYPTSKQLTAAIGESRLMYPTELFCVS